MVKQLVRHGNSAAIILDKPILELLNVKMETSLEITTDGKSIIISPMTEDKDEADLLNSLTKINKKHSKTLRKLGM